jgi:cytochrome P450
MPLRPPPPVSSNPLVRIAKDVAAERRATVPFPPGWTRFSMRRTATFSRDPLPLLLEGYERFGPVFTIRVLHGNVVFMLGPEANHYMTVSHAANFSWRDGHLGDMIPLLGDGLLTIDGEFHRRSRKIMLPAFHRDQIAKTQATMDEEVGRALAGWRAGDEVDLYAWTRVLALRIAMRALFGLDPDNRSDISTAHDFEEALGFWSRDYTLQVLRGPGTPWRRLMNARRRLDALIFAEIDRRRATGERGEDILSLLLDATDEDGEGLSKRHIRDEVMTLLFAGHDTTTSTVAFLFYELARDRGAHARVVEDLASGSTAELELAMDETLRLYPPAWIGPRRALEPFEFAGAQVPAGIPVNYCSWASHRLPDVWPEPERFDPQRFAPGNRELIPKGAYVPFGGGSRTCIGMRFGQQEIRTIAAAILERFEPELVAGYELEVRQMPTIGPKQGLPLVLRPPASGDEGARARSGTFVA